MTDATMTSSRAAAGQRAVRWLVAGVLLAVSATVAVSAWAQHGPGGPGHHGMGGAGMFMGSPEHMGRGVDHMLDGLNATDAQRSQIKQIVQAAANDLKGQREASRALRERGMQVFTTPNVDANAAEAVRKQMVDQHDLTSKRVLQAMIEISRVLTPEQRTTIGERLKMRHEAMKERIQRSERPKQ